MVSPQLPTPIRLAVVAACSETASAIARALRESSSKIRPVPCKQSSACERIRELRPDVILVRTTAGRSFLSTGFARFLAQQEIALVLLTPSGSEMSLRLAEELKPVLHLIEPLPSQALVAAVNLALARQQEKKRLQAMLQRRHEVVQTREIVDQAKAVLMRRLGLSEHEAHRRLQLESRNRNRRLADTARRVLQADVTLPAFQP